MQKKCPDCGAESELSFCPHCGKVFEYPSYIGSNESRQKSFRDFVHSVVSAAKQQKIDIASTIDSSTVRNAIYRKYFEKIAYLQKLCSSNTIRTYFMDSGSDMFEKMNDFAKRCEAGVCHIAVIGTVKAGKSAFINALIDKNIASSYPTPETASVTAFRKSEKGDYVKVSFYSSGEWNELWDSVHSSTANAVIGDENEAFLTLYNSLNAEDIRTEYLDRDDTIYYVNSLKECKDLVDTFTSARHREHFFAKEVEVGISDFFAPSNVVIVDTPGLDDPVPYRTEITRRYLKKADVVLLCIRSNRPEISATELQQLRNVFQALRYHKDRIKTIGTQIDEQDNMLDFWNKHTLPEYIKYLSKLYGTSVNAVEHIFPVSAFYYSYVWRAISNPQIFLGKTEEDQKLCKKIKEIIHRYYECPEFEGLVNEFGVEEALVRYRSPRQIFEEHKYELLNMTQVPQIRQMLLDGPIQDANNIILSDIKDLYIELNNAIQKIASDIVFHKEKTIETSQANDTLDKQILILEKEIKKSRKKNNEQAEKLNRLLSEMESKSLRSLQKIKG